MKVLLTETQVRNLQPYFDRVNSSAVLGKPGMLLAQIRWNNNDQRYWMEPAFLSNEYAQLVTEKGERC
jgi:hypothetical protein